MWGGFAIRRYNFRAPGASLSPPKRHRAAPKTTEQHLPFSYSLNKRLLDFYSVGLWEHTHSQGADHRKHRRKSTKTKTHNSSTVSHISWKWIIRYPLNTQEWRGYVCQREGENSGSLGLQITIAFIIEWCWLIVRSTKCQNCEEWPWHFRTVGRTKQDIWKNILFCPKDFQFRNTDGQQQQILILKKFWISELGTLSLRGLNEELSTWICWITLVF